MVPNGYEDCDVVWLTESKRFAFVTGYGAHYITVEYIEPSGAVVVESVPNDEYETWEERAIEFDIDTE